MISRFFIDRPIFATVLSVIITLIGGIALFFLPVAQYPRITPPGVVISINYPGASAKVVADTVAAPIEQQVNGVEGMLYMSSQSGNDGAYSLTVTFDIGTDLKTAVVKVQNRVALAMPQLPTEVQNQGITIRKKTPDILMIVNFFSPDGRYDDIYLSNLATIYVRDELLRVEGVSDVTYQGQRDYSIRVWLDPQKLAACNMTAIDVANAIRSQNLDAPAGQIGQPPSDSRQAFELPIDALGRLKDPEQFGDIIVKVGMSTPPQSPVAMAPPRAGAGLPTVASATSTAGATTTGSTTTGSTTNATNVGSTSPIDQSLAITGTMSATSGFMSTGAPAIGGATTGGGASSGGGGTTGGGGSTGGGGTTGGAATGSAASGSTASSSTTGSTPSLASVIGTSAGMIPDRGPGRPSASVVRLRDVARIELGAQNYNQSCRFDGHPAVGLSVYQLPGTNALDVADAVRSKMEELKTRFPDGVAYEIGYDTTPFIRESVQDVVTTMLEAVALVGLVVLVFLQDWRAMILPMIDVPVSIIGTFAVMAAVGFSLNNISLFGLVLAIGIVVDDAIVVLENIERMLARGFDVRTATIKAMDEVTGPIVAVALVLCAVFVPCAFISGITGHFFRQFAVTISVSTVISAINAITMTPSRAVVLFKKEGNAAHEHQREALPWWIFAIAGGLLTFWFGPRLALAVGGRIPFPDGKSAILSLQSLILFAPGALVGGLVGWFIIRPVNAVLGWLFRGFNHGFDGMSGIYSRSVGRLLRLSVIVLPVYCGLLALTYWVFQKAPTGFIPQQDQGRLLVNVQLPDSSSLQRTEDAVIKIEKIARQTPGVAHTVAISGLSFLLQANSPNFGSMFVVLDPFDKRQKPELRDTAIMARLRKEWAKEVKDAVVTVFGSSPIPGLGVAGGFKFIVEDRGDLGLEALQNQTEKLVGRLQVAGYRLSDAAWAALVADNVPETTLSKLKDLRNTEFESEEAYSRQLAKLLDKGELARSKKALLDRARVSSGLNSVATQFRSKTPQLFLDIDRTKAASLGVALNDVNQTLDMYMGSLYVNSFNDFGRHWQVTVQAEGKYRNQVEDLNLLQVRNKFGQMVLLGTLVHPREIGGPIAVTRYNLYTAASVSGNIQTGTSSGDAIKGIDRVANESLPLSMKTDWTELMFMQKRAGNTATYVFFLSIVSVFLALAALYESWSLPLAVILVVPLCLLCSVAGVLFTNRDVNIFVQIGLVVLVGLACKNAILVVEYAKQLHQEGRPPLEATVEASRLRLRPILMTSFAFIFGVIPLMIASGAGAEMRRSLGIAVFNGMVGVTLFGIFLTPVFFYVITGLGEAPLFSSLLALRLVSSTLGGLLGLAIGFLLGKLGVVRLPWAAFVGASAGILIVLSVVEIHRRIRPPSGPGGPTPFQPKGIENS
jgi:multidrug efflux pump subunit AcrB